MMTKADKRYNRKLRQVMKIIGGIKCTYEDWRNDVYTETNPDYTETKEAAIKILSKFGINQPTRPKQPPQEH